MLPAISAVTVLLVSKVRKTTDSTTVLSSIGTTSSDAWLDSHRRHLNSSTARRQVRLLWWNNRVTSPARSASISEDYSANRFRQDKHMSNMCNPKSIGRCQSQSKQRGRCLTRGSRTSWNAYFATTLPMTWKAMSSICREFMDSLLHSHNTART